MTEEDSRIRNLGPMMISAPAGVFKGSILTSFSGLPYAAYRGIPFALPPVGPLRFARPEPQPKLEGVYDATKEGPISIQPCGITMGPKQQEDCLYLNVFTPVPTSTTTTPDPVSEEEMGDEKTLKKVMVFIHGGGFFIGCANQHVPGDLVAQGNVVVVTFNYRLSWLGFLKGPTDEVKGNMGLWDQLEALKWVNKNICAFGGDPKNITLMGQSMGGESVTALSIMKQAKDLFTKGIIMSGTMFTCKSTPGSSDVLLDQLIDKTGLSEEGKTYSVLIQELRNLPEERFILPIQNEITNKFTTIDGELFPASFSEMKQDEEYLTRVGFYDRDHLVTLTNNEGQLVSTGPFSVTSLAKMGVSLPQRLGQSDSLHQKLYNWYSEPDHHEVAPLNDLLTDSIMLKPTFEFLQAATNKERQTDSSGNGRSYFLWFEHKPSYVPNRDDIQGTVHGLDLCYIFDISPDEIYKTYNGLRTDKGFTEEDRQLKRLYIDIIVDFMHHGNANSSLAPHLREKWLPFEQENEFYLSLKPKPAVKQFPLRERRNLWKNVVAEWIKEEKNCQ